MADGNGIAQSQLAIAKARLGLARASAAAARDADGDGKINDGKPNEGPAPAKDATPAAEPAKPVSAAGSSIHSSVIARLGAEKALRIKQLIETRAPASQIADSLREVAADADSIKPTLPEDQEPSPEFWFSRKYEGGKTLQQTVDGLIETAKAYAGEEVRNEHKAVLVVGAPAAGKSTFAEHMAQTMGAAIWDSDDAKKVIPEFQGGLGANAVHHESKMLTAFVGRRLMEEGANIVHPVIGHDVEKVKRLMGRFKDMGYEVDVVHVAVTPDEAMRRMAGRYLSTGRLIPPDYFMSVATKPAPTYHALRDSGALTDGYAEIDANGPRGSEVVTEANDAPPGIAPKRPVLSEGGSDSGRLPRQGAGGAGGGAGAKDRKPAGAVRKGGTLIGSAQARLALAQASAAIAKAKDPPKPKLSWFGAAFESFKHPRQPKGGTNGGQFAPKTGSGLSGKMSDGDWDKWFADEAKDHKAGHAGQSKVGLFGGYWGGAGDHQSAATKHPHVDDKGKEVWIERPTAPSPQSTWANPDAVATFIPGGDAPAELNGVPMASWKPPHDWNTVEGQDPALDLPLPEAGTKTWTDKDGKVHTMGMSVGAGVIVREPDGRVWLTSPTNQYGGYRNTFPKGTKEPNIASLQANAIKEAYEETGLKVKITGVLGDYKRTTSVARFFLAERVGGTPRDAGWESQAVRLAPAHELRKLLNMAHADHPIIDAYEALHGVSVKKGFDEGKHPRWPKGSPLGGQFKEMDSGTGLTAPPKLGWKKDGSGVGANANVYNKVVSLFEAAKAGKWDLLFFVVNGTDGTDAFGLNEYEQFLATGGKGMNTQAKWKAQTRQYALQLLAEKDAGVMATASAQSIVGPEKISGWTLIGAKPGGSAPGALYKDKDGVTWLVKGNLQGKDDDRAKNEVLASKLMELSGIPAPTYKLVDLGDKYGGGLGVAAKWIPDLETPVGAKGWALGQVQSQFAVHAWLGNYDSVGTGAGEGKSDNFGFDPKADKVICIDPGGSMLYRAQGTKKLTFEDSAPEWESMRSAKYPHSAAFYGSMTQSDLASSAKTLAAMDPAAVEKLVMEHGPGDKTMRENLALTLLKRRDAIMAKTKVGPFAEKPVATTHGAAETLESLGAAATPGYKFTWDGYHAKGDLKSLETAASNWAKGVAAQGGGPTGPNTKYLNALAADLKAKQSAAAPVSAVDLVSLKSAVEAHTPGTGGQMAVEGAYQNGDLSGLKKFASSWAKQKADGFTGPDGALTKYAQGLAADLEVQQAKKHTSTPGRILPVEITNNDLTAGSGDVSVLNGWAKAGSADNLKEMLDIYTKQATGEISGAIGPENAAKLAGHVKFLLKGKGAAEEVAAATASDAVKVAPAAPKWEDALTDSKSNLYNNNKVYAIKAAFEAGDTKAILALGYGTNTFAKKHVQVANDALAALGSQDKVAVGQKPNTHPALGGVAVDTSKLTTDAAKTVAKTGKKKLKPITTADLPPKPDFFNMGGTGKPLSSKAWKNQQNQDAVNAVEALALRGDVGKLKAMTFEVTEDNEVGAKTGAIKGMNLHPSKYVVGYYNDAVQFLNDYYNPVELPTVANSLKAKSLDAVAKHYTPKPLGTVSSKLHANERFGFWVGLGQVTNPDTLKPAQVRDLTPAEKQAGFTWYQGLGSSPDASRTRKFVQGMQGGGLMSAYRNGAAEYDGVDLEKMAQAAAKSAVELPEGATIYRWQNMDKSMVEALNKAQPGLVVQATGPMCASYHPTETMGFGEHKLVIRYAKGAKAIPSHGSGKYASEYEISTLPGNRFVYLGKKPSGHPGKGMYQYEFLMLPPHEAQFQRAKS